MTTLSSSRILPLGEHRFYTGMSLAMLGVVFVGFSRSFFLRPLFPTWPSPAEPLFYAHGAVFAAWIVLLVVQARLVAGGRTDLHRKVGGFGVALAAAMLVMGTWGALVAARRPTGFTGVPVPPLAFLAIPFFDMVLFALFVGLAIAQRGEPQSHKRWMLLATLILTTAALARWPMVLSFGPAAYFGLTDLFLVPLAIWDFRTRHRLHPVTLWGGLLLVVSQPLRLMVSGTPAWLAFAKWAVGLLG
jgi:hypothetical protein